ncbi:hypothetical protein NZ698_14485 [Chryseobacterium sp. PBS4-4]|uniref:Uncharacterized protein n=1 Tax=Chryseobacterium edaphi TaxID=2976532 RepID=A0ABT2W8U1_9FLAO|nr:hypothetical protein [Chryseobacterium edaphi]MCU7618404.1 hypothetical protein [Chryseobacterium edaphi]
MPNNPNILLDLLKDIDFSHPKNDVQQLDILIDTIQKSTASEKIFTPLKSTKVFLENSPLNINLKRKFEYHQVPETEVPKFEVEKSSSPFLNTELLQNFDLSSKFTIADQILGPFTAIDDIPVFYNFYKYINDFKIFFPGETQAALIIPVRLNRLVLINTRFNTFTLNKGNVWIRADLLDANAPQNNYIGLKITGGKITFGNSFPVANNSVTIPKDSRFEIEMSLDNSYQAIDNPTDVGIDAKKTVFTPPSSLKLTYFNAKFSLSAMEVLHGSCFGWESYIRGNDQTFIWDAESRCILLKLASEQETFQIRNCESGFYELKGQAKIRYAFWMLPSRVLNQNQSLEVKLNGALRLELLQGLSADWDGIRVEENVVQINQCQLFFYNGEINIQSKRADYNLLHEHFTLWQKSPEKPYKMELDLSFSQYQSFVLQSQSAGTELISANVDSEFLIDKPLRANNHPIHPKTKQSIYAKGITSDKKIIILSDSDLISETEDPNISTDTSIYQFAIENAYFTTSKEVSVFLNANWTQENHLFEGKLTFNYLLYDILPTLPHPYTSNILPHIERVVKGHDIFYNKIGVLQSIITWQTTNDFAESEVNFKLSQQKFISNSQNYALAQNEFVRNSAFTLLDVSTESDHWGISLNFDHLDELRKVYHDDVNVTGENVVTISRNNLHAPLALLEGITLPHVSWEPVYNQTKPFAPDDPKEGILTQQNNPIPTVFSQFSNQMIAIHPKNFIRYFKANLKSKKGVIKSENLQSKILFTLPNGKYATVSLSPYNGEKMMNDDHLEFIMPEFKHQNQEFSGSIQLRIAAKKQNSENKPPLMRGRTIQIKNLVEQPGISILGESVTFIFNNVFNKNNQIKDKGVPLTHIDFSGYGASTFSNWKDSSAKFASIAQAKFDILKGRTAHEIVQAVSVIYPWGIGTTRTVTFLRNNNAIIFREDSGWVAQSEGLFDFSFTELDNNDNEVFFESPYEIYPGLTEGLFNIRNIKEDPNDIFTSTYTTQNDDYYFNPNSQKVKTAVPGIDVDVRFVAVYFDADVKLNALDENVTGKQFKGYLQLMPEGSPVPARVLKEMFDRNQNSLGGSIDTTFNIEKTLQKFKANRVEVSASYQNDDQYNHVFVSSVKGSTILPSEGSWSVVEIDRNGGEVSNLEVGTSVGLIKDGMRPKNLVGVFTNTIPQSLLAFPDSLKNSQTSFGKAYGLLQNTDTQKLLLNAPEFVSGLADQFESQPALLADCFRLMNSKGPFPNIFDAITIDDAAKTAMGLLPKGIQKAFKYEVPDQFSFNVFGDDGDAFRIYVKYDSSDPDGQNTKKSVIDFVTDSSAVEQWTNRMQSLTIAVDLLGFKPIMYVTGNFGNGKKFNPSIELGNGPQLKLHPLLQKIYEVLEFLDNLDPTNPSEAIKKGLKIAMSNSADSWEYKFKADKEIPLVKFPFDPINYNSPTTPLKLDAFFRLGVYFNQPIKIPNTIDQIKPSIGAYLELGADMRVMCVSLAAATIYAQGRAEVGLSADLNNPPTLHFKFGFGIELCVGLPVIGSVSVTYMVGIDMKINASILVVGAFIYFRGRVEIAGGLVTVAISIEAAGQIEKIDDGPTNCVAMCTFALDISVAFVINLNFTETWKETRQIS